MYFHGSMVSIPRIQLTLMAEIKVHMFQHNTFQPSLLSTSNYLPFSSLEMEEHARRTPFIEFLNLLLVISMRRRIADN